MKAKIHSIESLSTVDGPGMRFVVFMQGCQIKCKFCHNPDTWCIQDGKEMDVQEILEKIKRSKNYLVASNGGVTFTGGEPMLQQDFLLEILPQIKKLGIHIAIDTNGVYDVTDKVKKILEYVDLVLLDIKHIDEKTHKQLTGVSNEKTLSFAKYLDSINKNVWIRVVYMPGITDKEDSLKKLKEYIDSLKNVEKVEVLPYHEMGIYKWKELNMEYELKDQRVPSKEETNKIQEYLNNKK